MSRRPAWRGGSARTSWSHRAMLPISLDTLSFKVQRVFPMNRFDTDVLIVGGGPAGLAAAATLGHYGVSALVAERRSAPSPIPRARPSSALGRWRSCAAGSSRTRSAPGASKATSRSGSARPWRVRPRVRATRSDTRVGEQAAVVSPTAPSIVPQDWLEIVLRRHIETLPSVRLELGRRRSPSTTDLTESACSCEIGRAATRSVRGS